ncbi:MAG TPA: alpha/beta hydrolase [Polyangiaceae bacterium]|nr:alpha/beta hydrolase [Polyangiaceae bacterium]
MTAWKPTVRDRIERFVARALLRLPHDTLLRLSGAPQIVIEGEALHPEIQFMLAARKRRRAHPLRAETAELARSRVLAETRRYAADPIPLSVTDIRIPSRGHALPARHYAPPEPGGPHPLLVFFHGGGFVVGDIETHDEACRLLCQRAGVHVLAVAYRLAPEHPFPAAIEDGEEAYLWARENAAALGADPSKIGVGGDSAGGNIAAVVTQIARAAGKAPAFQLLLYPVVDRTTPRPSHELFANGFFLERADIEFFDVCYGASHLSLDERVSPIRAAAPPDVPTVLVTAAFDPLRDEGEAYAAWLMDHGTPTILRRMPGMIHGFINLTSVSRAADLAVTEIAALLRRTSRAPQGRGMY